MDETAAACALLNAIKMKESMKQTFMDQGMDPSAREARRVSPANAGNSVFVERS